MNTEEPWLLDQGERLAPFPYYQHLKRKSGTMGGQATTYKCAAALAVFASLMLV